MNKSKIFISRKLESNSVFFDALDSNSFDIQHEYLISFSALDFEKPHSDWLFFYSKKGVEYYCKKFNVLPYKIAVFGSSTAQSLRSITGVFPNFIGTGQAGSTAVAFSKILMNDSCTWVIGKNSLRSVQKQLNNTHTKVNECIVYKNTPISPIDVAYPNIAMFTSPLSVKNYYNHYPSRTHPNIAIGTTTAAALQECTKNQMVIAKEPSEKGLLNAFINFINKAK